MFRATGDDNLFYGEQGGHRIQQLSGSGKKQRIHTSTITIAVLEEAKDQKIIIKPNDLEWKTCRSTGSGGQSINTTDSAVQLTHLPTGIMIRSESEKSQAQNKETALKILKAKLYEQQNKKATGERADSRKQQVGRGERADKRRTIRYQDEQVVDHITGRKWRLKNYIKGDWE